MRRLDALVVSHDDIDHAGGAQSVLRALPVADFLSSLPAGHPARAASSVHRTCDAGQEWTWDGVHFRMLHPAPGSHAAVLPDNERSCVLLIEAGPERLLVTGMHLHFPGFGHIARDGASYRFVPEAWRQTL